MIVENDDEDNEVTYIFKKRVQYLVKTDIM